MNRDEILQVLRRLVPETGSLACLGCGHEHRCSTHGCAIIRAAAKEIETLAAHNSNAPLTLEELREMIGEPVYTDGSYFILDCLEDDGLTVNRALIHMTDGTMFEWNVSRGLYPRIYRRRPEERTM